MGINIKGKLKTKNNKSETIFPIDILTDITKDINEQLDGIVTVSVKEYDKPIESYETLGLSSVLAGFTTSKYVNIQDQLGEIGEAYFKYEVVFESTYLPDYKYRLMFVGNGISGYPAKIVLAESVAHELNKEVDADYRFDVKDSDSFKKYVEAIFNCKSVLKIFSNIVRAVERQQRLKAEGDMVVKQDKGEE